MSVKIIVDSTTDLNEAIKDQVAIVPLTICFGEEEYVDGVTITHHQFYEKLVECDVLPTTSQASPAAFSRVLSETLAPGDSALILTLSSELSGTYQSAVIAAEELKDEYPDRKIQVIDTLCASMGEGLLVWYACKKRDEGLSLDEVAQWVLDNRLHLCHWFTVDDLMYLKRGGRISAATALVGTMLQIKPLLHVDDEGHLINMTKTRGRKAAIDAMVKKAQELGAGYDNSTMFISHGDCLSDAEYLSRQLKEKCGVKDVVISYVGAVIGSHSGPGTLALFFLGSHR